MYLVGTGTGRSIVRGEIHHWRVCRQFCCYRGCTVTLPVVRHIPRENLGVLCRRQYSTVSRTKLCDSLCQSVSQMMHLFLCLCAFEDSHRQGARLGSVWILDHCVNCRGEENDDSAQEHSGCDHCANCRSEGNDDSAQEWMRVRRCKCAPDTGATREMPTKVSIYFLRLGRKAQRLEPPHRKPTFKARIGDLVKTTAIDFFLLHTIPRSDELNPGRVQGMSLHCSQETPAHTITMASAI